MQPVSLATLLAANRGVDPARVLLVDPDPATRDRLKRLLGSQLVGEAASVDGALQAVAALRPTVIVTAAMLEDEPDAGLRLTSEAGGVDPNVQTVLHAAELPAEVGARARDAMILVVRTTDRPSALLNAVRAANDIYRVLEADRRSAEPEAGLQTAYPPRGAGAGDARRPG